MVKLNKIYTRTGDDGSTGLGTGDRVAKNHPRVEAYGSVDEANASIGLAICSVQETDAKMAELLRGTQNDLFDVGADLCIPRTSSEAEGAALRVSEAQVHRLEHLIDEHNARLEPLTSFILPGGSPQAAHLHVARTAVRHAERVTVKLLEMEPDGVNVQTVRYLNRLSDLLFVLARVANEDGKADVLWVPGARRGGDQGNDDQGK